MADLLTAVQRAAEYEKQPGRRVGAANMRIRTYTAKTIAECLLQAKLEMGLDAVILSKKNVRKGALFGRWFGKPMVEVTFGMGNDTDDYASRSERSSSSKSHNLDESANTSYLQKLENQIAGLAASVQTLVDSNGNKKKVGASVGELEGSMIDAPSNTRRWNRGGGNSRQAEAAPQQQVAPENYAGLFKQLTDAEIAAPLARQMIADLPEGLTSASAASELRTLISQRLLIANRVEIQPGAKMRVLAFVGTTGVGKTTTIAKLAAQYGLVERRRVGVITLDTQRIAAAQQLQTYGDILRVPVKIAHDKAEMVAQLSDYAREGMDLVLLDTAGRSPNDMLPLGETAHLFEHIGVIQKFLAIPASLAARDMENVIARFKNTLSPDAMILTKLDEATDNACFGKLMNVQAKFGIPLAYVTTGQKVPDDIAFPDSHAIAARILSTAIL